MMRTLVLSFLIVLAAAPVNGFFPETKEIQGEIKDNLGRISSLQAEIEPVGENGLVWRIWQKGELWRTEWVDKEKNRVVCAGLGRGNEIYAAYPAGSKPGPVPSWLLLRDIPWLEAHGLKTAKKEYAFVGNRPCVILGEYGPEKQGMRLWVDNEKMLPVRMDPGESRQLLWRKYHRAGNYPLPQQMELSRHGDEPREFRINWTGINISIPDELFSVSRFKDSFARAASPGLPDVVRYCNRFFSGFFAE